MPVQNILNNKKLYKFAGITKKEPAGLQLRQLRDLTTKMDCVQQIFGFHLVPGQRPAGDSILIS
jgi:hypothetical protein